MARSFTVTQLVTRCQQRADMENSGLISDSEWKTLLSEAYGELHSILVKSGMRYFESEDTVTADGSSSYSLPSDFLASIGVDYEADPNGTRWALREAMVQERDRYTGTNGDPATAYALVGSSLELYPTPSSGTYYHVYVPQPTDLSGANDADSVDVVTADGESFVVWHVTVNALSKEQSNMMPAVHERDAARARLEEWSILRSINTPRRPMLEGDYDWDPADWRYW